MAISQKFAPYRGSLSFHRGAPSLSMLFVLFLPAVSQNYGYLNGASAAAKMTKTLSA